MNKQLPIIFLDFDGVLNHQLHFQKVRLEQKSRKDEELSPESIKLLNTLIKNTGAKVVVTSTWRLGRSVAELQAILNQYGFEGEVIDKTISFRNVENGAVLRGNEILHWTKKNKELIGADYYDYKRYVILDDDSDMLYWQKDNFICVDSYCGITPKTIFMAEKILVDKSGIWG